MSAPRAAGAADAKEEEKEDFKTLKLTKGGRIKVGTTLPRTEYCADMDGGNSHSWSPLPATKFEVRKKGYVTKGGPNKGVKAPSLAPLYDIVVVDFVKSKKAKLTHVASYFDGTSLPKIDAVPGKDHKIPGYITFSIIIHNEASSMLWGSSTDSGSLHLHCIAKLSDESRKHLESGKMTESLTLWDNFIKSDFKGDKKSGNTLKMIGRCANEKEATEKGNVSMFVKPLFIKFNGVPFLIFKAARYYWRHGIIDIEVDSHLFAGAAKKGIDSFREYMKVMVVDIAAIIEGRCDDHLPEQCLATARAYRLDPAKAVDLDEKQQKAIKDLPDEDVKSDE